VDQLKSILSSESLVSGTVTFCTKLWKFDSMVPRPHVSIFEKQEANNCFYHAIHCLLNRQLFCKELADQVIPALANYIFPGVVVDNATGRGLKSPEYFKHKPTNSRSQSDRSEGFEMLTNFSDK
jgi:hypothetical protein